MSRALGRRRHSWEGSPCLLFFVSSNPSVAKCFLSVIAVSNMMTAPSSPTVLQRSQCWRASSLNGSGLCLRSAHSVASRTHVLIPYGLCQPYWSRGLCLSYVTFPLVFIQRPFLLQTIISQAFLNWKPYPLLPPG